MSHNLTKIKPKTTEAYWENNLREKQGKLTEKKKSQGAQGGCMVKHTSQLLWWHHVFVTILALKWFAYSFTLLEIKPRAGFDWSA